MASFSEKFKNLIGLSPEQDPGDLDDGSDLGYPEDGENMDDGGYGPGDGYPPDPDYPEDDGRTRNFRTDNVVDMSAQTTLQVVLAKPEHFDDASAIADHLNAKRTVVLNLESTTRDVARRLIDFLSGVAYANSGQLKRVANSTFIITPYNVSVTGDLIDELENNGFYHS